LPKNRKKYLKLEYLRKKYGYKQSDMAILLGMCTSAYSHKENGFSPVTFDECLKIRDVLNKQAKKAGDATLTLEDIFLH
jgi:Predicted transcriptional regulators